jgi:uncharacterized RDD family membrane protein YckC
MLYEMLLGRVPFEGSSMGEVLMKHLTMQPEVDQLPPPFGEVIRKALAKDPNERYQTVTEMMEVLLGVDAIRESVAGFNPTGLSMAARRAAPDLPDAPSPSPPPPTPPRAVPAFGQTPNAYARGGAAAQPVASPGGLGRPAVPDAFPVAQAVSVERLSPEAATGKLYYAGFWIRVVAALIDLVVVSAATAAIAMLFGGPVQNNPIWIAVSVAYDGLLIGRWNGQTLGKKTCGIKVISADGRPCGQWQAFARALANILNAFTLGFAYLMVAFSRRKRGLHDHIAGTLHVYALR